MSSSTAASHPRWLLRRPHGLAAWLVCRNALRRYPVLWPGAALVAAALIGCCSRSVVIMWLQRCAAHPIPVALVAAVCTATATTRRKAAVRRALAGSWLASLPARPSRLMHTALAPLAAWALIAAALVIAVAAGLAPAAAAAVILPALAGAAAGFLIGWLLPHVHAEATPASWYGVIWQVRNSGIRATLLPLGLWAVSRTRVWGRPKITARWALLVLLGIPLGTSAAYALAVVAAVLVGWHLLTLLAAVVRVSFAAGWWLAPTAVGFVPFTASLVYLAWLRQVIICALALAAVAALGRPRTLPGSGALVAAWLTLCVISGVAACGLALHSRTPVRSRLHRRSR
ncbi:MAG: hypothetical protein ACRETK_09015 [Steroidobacteraceae bacterium]